MEQVVGGAVGGVIGLLLVALIGLVIGAIAKLLVPGPDPGGWFVTLLLGIAGLYIEGLRAGRTSVRSPVRRFSRPSSPASSKSR